ncbi:type II toxin-antitoxin system RelE family toxin [Mumia quercus]|uniref:type II toxin-antitoxin system RelE family toxin n=1 Tax=Mumia quercus TaxID=2976125 RepID=UPI0021CFBF2E|nr:type II toxin-antitoxin system RelE/ParE family toxin [Mumia quercus]
MKLSGSAIRDMDRLPPRVVPAVIEFLFGPLANEPRRVGKPLRDDFDGEWSARRGSYRVLYRIEDDLDRIIVTRLAHRADVYRPR